MERYCRNDEEIGDKYFCTYGCPVNVEGQGVCSKMLLFPAVEAIGSGENLENAGGGSQYDCLLGGLCNIPADGEKS